jgi:hypothetical protein
LSTKRLTERLHFKSFSKASDDLVYPSLFEILFRSTWLVSQIILYTIHNQKFECVDFNLLKVYFIGFLCTLISIITIQAVILYISMRGTISDSEPRRAITKFIYVRIVLMIFEVVWSSIGTSSSCLTIPPPLFPFRRKLSIALKVSNGLCK